MERELLKHWYTKEIRRALKRAQDAQSFYIEVGKPEQAEVFAKRIEEYKTELAYRKSN